MLLMLIVEAAAFDEVSAPGVTLATSDDVAILSVVTQNAPLLFVKNFDMPISFH